MISALAAIGVGAGIALAGVLLGASIARAPCRCGRPEHGDDDDGDGGDEDEIDLPFDAERVLVIAVPRHDAPGAPAPGKTETN